MRKLDVDKLQVGMVLGKEIINERGDALLMRGITLSPQYIDSLRSLGIHSVYVRDGIADDVEPADILSARVRNAALNHLQDLFSVAENAAFDGTEPLKPEVLEQFADLARPHMAELNRDVEKIIQEATTSDTLSGVFDLKSHDSYTFEHSVEVTVAGVMLGKRLSLEIHDLHQLALGCLCHDIGKLIVPQQVLGKPGRLTAEEFALVQQHPQAGYEVVQRMMGASDIIARQVVRQHHERQDGKGYPRGLRGSNGFGARAQQRFGQGLILPAAEIAAIADVYSALASDRPYRAALSPEEIVTTLRHLAGSQLNNELVTRFLSILPSYPIGTEVVVTSGKLTGYRGIVTDVNRSNIHRPTVRIVFDPRGKIVAPFEVDTNKERDVVLTASSYSNLAVAEAG